MRRTVSIGRASWKKAVVLAGLVGLLTIAPRAIRAQQDGRVFALLVIDTDAKIAGLEDDEAHIGMALTGGFAGTRLLDLRVLKGADVRPDAIVNRIQNLPVGPNDTLLFYYTGHGATFEGQGHVLTTSGGNLTRARLRSAVVSKRPRLSVILTDCCSSLVKPRPREPGVGAPAPTGQVSPVLRCLLLQHQGVVDLTSSSFGEISWSRQGTGGLFTFALSQAMGAGEIEPLDTNKDGFLKWSEVFDLVRQQTQEGFREFKKDFLNQDPRGMDRGTADRLRAQLDQVPQAFALGDTAGAIAAGEFYAPNLKATYRMVPVGDAAGAQLTEAPAQGSALLHVWVTDRWIYLEPNDVIYNLDSLPIREAVDPMNHHGRTTIEFIDHRTGKAYSGVMTLAPYTPLPNTVPQEQYAANIGIHYQLMPLGDGTFGARVSRNAQPNVPAGVIQLERGDMIIRLDGQPIQKPEDVLAHVDRTTVEFVNIRTGKVESRIVQLPGRAGR